MARFRKEKLVKHQDSIPRQCLILFLCFYFSLWLLLLYERPLFLFVWLYQLLLKCKTWKKNLVSYIYIGIPLRPEIYGSEPRIQLNDQFGTVEQISEFIEMERAARPEQDRPFLTTSLKVDKDVRMGIVTDVKQELRKVGAYKINYSTRKVHSIID